MLVFSKLCCLRISFGTGKSETPIMVVTTNIVTNGERKRLSLRPCPGGDNSTKNIEPNWRCFEFLYRDNVTKLDVFLFDFVSFARTNNKMLFFSFNVITSHNASFW